jgi:hypothetical protein
MRPPPDDGASPDSYNHLIEHRVGRDDGDATTERGRGQEAIEWVTVRPFHIPRHEAVGGLKRCGDASLARKQRWQALDDRVISGHLPRRAFCAISKNEIALTRIVWA